MMPTLRQCLTAMVCLLVPGCLGRAGLRALGHRIAPGVRIAPSLVLTPGLWLGQGSAIGWGNVVWVRRLVLRDGARIGRTNYLRGPFSLALGRGSEVGNRNVVTRARGGVSYGPARFRLGSYSKITSGHMIDCMRSVSFGERSILAGKGSQLWTHGYVHTPSDRSRARVDGGISVGDDVFIGSMCCVSPGIRIHNAVTIGSLSSVARPIDEAGLYVSAPLRRLATTPEERLGRLERVEEPDLVEPVYRKWTEDNKAGGRGP